MNYGMILKKLKWNRSTFYFSFPHHFANFSPEVTLICDKVGSTLVHTILYLFEIISKGPSIQDVRSKSRKI